MPEENSRFKYFSIFTILIALIGSIGYSVYSISENYQLLVKNDCNNISWASLAVIISTLFLVISSTMMLILKITPCSKTISISTLGVYLVTNIWLLITFEVMGQGCRNGYQKENHSFWLMNIIQFMSFCFVVLIGLINIVIKCFGKCCHCRSGSVDIWNI